jgi:hypothetical protein
MKTQQPIEAFIQGINHQNASELLAVFNSSAVISDEGRDYRGTSAFKEWFQEKCISPNVTLKPIETIERDGTAMVNMQVDGDFDKTVLPDPLQLDFHFTLVSNKVDALSIRFPISPPSAV